jgi:hypothetical protein
MVTHHLQRILVAIHADSHVGYCAHFRSHRPRLPGLDLLHVPQTHQHRQEEPRLLIAFQVERWKVEGYTPLNLPTFLTL